MALLVFLLTIATGLLYAQEVIPDTTAQDTTARSSGLDTVIAYSADAIDFDIFTRTSILEGNARIEYKDMELSAGRILFNWDEQTMIATAMFDTLYSDSAETEVDTVVEVGRPRFKQGSEEFTGDEIAYNIKTKIGRVKGGRTAYQDGSYYGEQFKRISDDVLTVRHGEFTTCDLAEPHYHFGGDVLKIEVGERVVARPVYLYFDDVPVLALPYGVFPIQKGRTSGIITPVFGESAAQGRFLRNIGYYWAISDYMDVLSTMDYYEVFGVLGRTNYRYAKRNRLNGNADFDFDTQRRGTSRNRRWQISANHNQTIDQTTRLAASGGYVSDKSYREQVGTVNDQLNQTIQSNATLSKTWNNSPWSASVNAGFTQNIRQETWNARVPAVRFTHKQGRLFPAPKAPRNIRFATTPKETVEPWYRAFSWTYSSSYSNDLALPHTFVEEGLRPDSLGNLITVFGDDSLTVRQRDGMGHTGGLSAAAKLARYVNLNPSINWQHGWTRKVVHYEAAGDLFDREDQYGFFTRTTFNAGATASTKLYGLARNPFGVRAQFRHVMTPTVGFRYSPDFSDKEWGYYESVTLDDGMRYEYDRFRSSDQAGVFGGDTPKGLSQSMSLRLGNLFQMKHGDEEAGTEKKFDLLSADFSSAIDFKRDSLKWNDIQSSFRTSLPGRLFGPIEGVGLDLSTTHSMYERVGGRPVNRFFWESDGGAWYAPFDLLHASGSVDFSVRADRITDLVRFRTREENSGTDSLLHEQLPGSLADGIPDEELELPPLPEAEADETQTFLDMPLSLTFSLRHDRNYLSQTRTTTLSSDFTTQLTPLWNVSGSYYFDLDTKLPRNASLSLTRDLHCWEASLSWMPLGFSSGYYLRIGLKSPQLRDLKIERNQGRNLRGF